MVGEDDGDVDAEGDSEMVVVGKAASNVFNAGNRPKLHLTT